MKFEKFKQGKTLSLANLLSLSNYDLAQELQNCDYRYISCLEDPMLENDKFIKCEIGSISYVLALICKYRLGDHDYFNGLDDGFLSGECSVGEEEFEELNLWLKDCQNIIIDSSFFALDDAKLVFEFLNLLNVRVILADSDLSEFNTNSNLSELKELKSYDGSVIFEYVSHKKEIKGGLNFAAAAKIKNGDKIELMAENLSIKGEFILDISNKSTVAFVGVNEINGYNFKLVKVEKI